MLPEEMLVIARPAVVLAASAARTPAFERQHERLASGAGYSYAIADATTDVAVGQAGLLPRHGGTHLRLVRRGCAAAPRPPVRASPSYRRPPRGRPPRPTPPPPAPPP